MASDDLTCTTQGRAVQAVSFSSVSICAHLWLKNLFHLTQKPFSRRWTRIKADDIRGFDPSSLGQCCSGCGFFICVHPRPSVAKKAFFIPSKNLLAADGRRSRQMASDDLIRAAQGRAVQLVQRGFIICVHPRPSVAKKAFFQPTPDLVAKTKSGGGA